MYIQCCTMYSIQYMILYLQIFSIYVLSTIFIYFTLLFKRLLFTHSNCRFFSSEVSLYSIFSFSAPLLSFCNVHFSHLCSGSCLFLISLVICFVSLSSIYSFSAPLLCPSSVYSISALSLSCSAPLLCSSSVYSFCAQLFCLSSLYSFSAPLLWIFFSLFLLCSFALFLFSRSSRLFFSSVYSFSAPLLFHLLFSAPLLCPSSA